MLLVEGFPAEKDGIVMAIVILSGIVTVLID
jgi:hypothetical protein